ncbi:hypothetical protein BH24ACT15_BH24ACT15_29950 [soil metagenome]
MTDHEILVKARNLLPGHWTQGNGESPGTFCSMGALVRAVTDRPFEVCDTDQYVRAALALARAVGHQYADAVVAFNDTEGRTEAEVLGMFDRAIEATAPDTTKEGATA